MFSVLGPYIRNLRKFKVQGISDTDRTDVVKDKKKITYEGELQEQEGTWKERIQQTNVISTSYSFKN